MRILLRLLYWPVRIANYPFKGWITLMIRLIPKPAPSVAKLGMMRTLTAAIAMLLVTLTLTGFSRVLYDMFPTLKDEIGYISLGLLMTLNFHFWDRAWRIKKFPARIELKREEIRRKRNEARPQ